MVFHESDKIATALEIAEESEWKEIEGMSYYGDKECPICGGDLRPYQDETHRFHEPDRIEHKVKAECQNCRRNFIKIWKNEVDFR